MSLPQEEDFADTGYQVTSTDASNETSALTEMRQLGALTAEDFEGRPATSTADNMSVRRYMYSTVINPALTNKTWSCQKPINR